MPATTATKALVRRYIGEVWNAGHLAALEQLVTADFIGHDPGTRRIPRGRADLEQVITTYRTAVPDLTLSIEQQVSEGDHMVTRWTAHGTHLGPLWAIGPTGRQVSVCGLSLHHVRGGRLAEEWTTFDALALVQHLWEPPARLPATASAS